jgi:hypothetical protein
MQANVVRRAQSAGVSVGCAGKEKGPGVSAPRPHSRLSRQTSQGEVRFGALSVPEAIWSAERAQGEMRRKETDITTANLSTVEAVR